MYRINVIYHLQYIISRCGVLHNLNLLLRHLKLIIKIVLMLTYKNSLQLKIIMIEFDFF